MGAHFMYKPLKTPTTYKQQVALLKSRGILVSNDSYCEKILSKVNYYRLSGYILPFISKPEEKCIQPISIEQINGIYNFDTELRSLLIPVIEKIEIYLRTQLSYYSAHHFGADGYLDAGNYNRGHDHVKFLGLINKCISDNNKSPVVKHHIAEYGGKFPILGYNRLFYHGNAFSFLYRYDQCGQISDCKIIIFRELSNTHKLDEMPN